MKRFIEFIVLSLVIEPVEALADLLDRVILTAITGFRRLAKFFKTEYLSLDEDMRRMLAVYIILAGVVLFL